MIKRRSYGSLTLIPYYIRIYLERLAGIEPASSAWKAEVLPLNYARTSTPELLAENGSR